MKKIILTVAAVFAFGVANAQIKTEAGTFNKPTTGTYIMEATMTPNIAGGGIFSLSGMNGNSGIDSGLGMLGIKVRKFTSDSKALRLAANLTVFNSSEEVNGSKADTEFKVGLSYGIENHMKGAERLSTYWGYEGNVGYVKSNGTTTEPGKVTKFGVGGNVFTGFDYYIMPKIYLGAEVSYGLAVTNTTPDGADGITKIQLAPGITPSFRLGWQF